MFPKNDTCKACPLRFAPSLSGRQDPPNYKFADKQGVPLLVLYSSPDTASIGKNFPFYSSAEQLVERVLREARGKEETMNGIPFRMEYAIPCGHVGRLPKGVDARCRTHLEQRIALYKPQTVLALGATTCKMLGLKVRRFADVRGKTIETTVAGHRFLVVPSFEPYQVNSNPGLFRIFRQDIFTLGRFAGRAWKGENITPPSVETLTEDYIIPKTIEEVRDLRDKILGYSVAGKLAEKWPLVFDIETTSLETWGEKFRVIAIAFAWDRGRAGTIMLDHAKTPYDAKKAWKYVRQILASPQPKIAHNAPFDLAGLEHALGTPVRNMGWDTLMAEHLLDEDKKGHYGLKVLTATYTPAYSGYEDKLWDQLVAAAAAKESSRKEMALEEIEAAAATRGIVLAENTIKETKKKKRTASEAAQKKKLKKQMKEGFVTFEDVDVDLLCRYAGLDADITWQIFSHQNTLFSRESHAFYELMRNHYIPGTRALADIQHRGVKVDLNYMGAMEADMDAELGRLYSLMAGVVGREFNPNSKVHLSTVVLEDLALKPLGFTETGQLKIDKEIIKRYVSELTAGTLGHTFMKSLARYKVIHKGRTGFLKSIRALVDARGFLHGSYHLNGTETGRLSSSAPNMQNWAKFIGRVIDKETDTILEPGYNLKRLLIPSGPGKVFFNMDYSGAEIRVFCAYTKDANLIKAILDGMDTHSYITSLVAGVPYEEVQPVGGERPKRLDKLRDKVKRVVFGTLYGGSVHTMAAILGISKEEAQEIVDAIFGVLPSLPEYIEYTKAEVMRDGYVETFFGRRRHFRMAQMDRSLIHKCNREATNFKIQSTSSDITFGQLLEIHRELPKIGGVVLGTVHDSVFGEVEESAVPRLHEFFTYWAEDRVAAKFPWLPVPFAYDLEVGPNYGELKRLKKVS